MVYNSQNKMKRTIIVLAMLLFTTLVFPQVPLSVLGINPNTTMKKFNLALSKKGIRPTQTATGLYEYNVKYAGYSNCSMEVKFNSGNDSLLCITIDIPHESIAKDKSIFENLTKQFKEKYGNESDFGEEMTRIKEEYTGHSIRRTRYERSYGMFNINMCYVKWYFNDDEYEDGVEVTYYTNAKGEKKVSVSSDI